MDQHMCNLCALMAVMLVCRLRFTLPLIAQHPIVSIHRLRNKHSSICGDVTGVFVIIQYDQEFGSYTKHHILS